MANADTNDEVVETGVKSFSGASSAHMRRATLA